MAIHLNRVILVGRLGAEPEAKGQTGDILNLRVATSERWLDKQTGEYAEKTQWHTVVIFNEHVAKRISRDAKKGDLVCVEGQLETRKWDRSAEGKEDKYFTEIIVRPYTGNVQVLPKDPKPFEGEDRASRPLTKERTEANLKKAEEVLADSAPKKGGYRRFDDDEDPF